MKKHLSILVIGLVVLLSASCVFLVPQTYAGGQLTVLYMSSVYADAARAMAPEFEKATGAKVQVVDFPYATLHEKELLDLTSKTGSFDVISVACQWDGELAPYLEPLASYMKKSKFDTKDFIPNVLNNAGRWQGKVYGIPHASTPYVMAYRTDLVKKLPKTWDEYLEIAKQYTKPSEGMYGIATPAAKSQFGSLFCIRLWSMGGEWADANWKVTMNNNPTRQAMKHCKDMLKYADPAATSWGIPEANNAFLQGKAAFCESWPTLGIVQDGDNPEKSKIVGKWALAEFPHEKTGLTNLSGWDLAINKGSKNKDLAWEWVKMYTSAQKQLEFFDKFQIPGPRNSFWNSDEFKKSKLGAMGAGTLRAALDRSIIWWRIPASNEAKTELSNAVSAYMTGQMDLDQAIKYADDALTRSLANNPPPKGVKNDLASIVKRAMKK